MLELAEHTAKSTAMAVQAVTEAGSGVLNGVPLVGHLKGAAHYAAGDREGGDEAMRQASRTVGVVAGGVAAMAGGPAMMVAGGIAGGAVMDALTTGVESAIKEEFVPCGYVRAIDNVIKARDGQSVVEGVVEGITTPIMDGLVGRAAAGTIKKAAGRVKKVGGGARVAAKVAKSTVPSFDGGTTVAQNVNKHSGQAGYVYTHTLDGDYVIGVGKSPRLQVLSVFYQSWECDDIDVSWTRILDKLHSGFKEAIVEDGDAAVVIDGDKVSREEVVRMVDDIVRGRLLTCDSKMIEGEIEPKTQIPNGEAKHIYTGIQ